MKCFFEKSLFMKAVFINCGRMRIFFRKVSASSKICCGVFVLAENIIYQLNNSLLRRESLVALIMAGLWLFASVYFSNDIGYSGWIVRIFCLIVIICFSVFKIEYRKAIKKSILLNYIRLQFTI